MNSANIQRNGYIDFVKGILIYLVVLGHAIQFIGFGESYLFWYDKLWKFIYTFHMPLFIAINGYFSFFSIKKNTYSNFFIKRVLALLVPMIAWCIISIIIDSTSNKIDSSIMMYNLVVRIEGLYWFIWAIIFYGFISSTLSKIKLDNLFTFIVIGFIIMFFSNKNPIFDLIESMYPFFVIGFQLAKLKLEKYYYWVQKSLPFLFVINILCILFWDKRTYIYITPSQWVT